MKPWFRVGHCLPSWDIEDVTPLTPDYKQQPAKVYLGPCRCCLWKSTGLMTPLLVICSDAPGGKAVPSELWKLWITAPLTNALFTYQRGPVPEGRGGGPSGPSLEELFHYFFIHVMHEYMHRTTRYVSYVGLCYITLQIYVETPKEPLRPQRNAKRHVGQQRQMKWPQSNTLKRN